MATLSIPWKNGPGNIVLTYTGQGNGTVVVTSDANNLDYERQQTISFYVTNGAIREDIMTHDSLQLRTSDGKQLTCLNPSMKVSVTVIQRGKVILLANGAQLVTSDGNLLRVFPESIN